MSADRCRACYLAYVGQRDRDGVPEGHGLLTVSTLDFGGGLRSSHFGFFHKGRRHGIGKTQLLDDQICLAGEWYEDEMCGSGRITVANCFRQSFPYSLFEGAMVESLPEGPGRLVWQTGQSFLGHFHRGLREGGGDLWDASNRLLVRCANWSRDLPEGWCELCRLPNEMVYVGLITAGEFGPLGKLFECERGRLIYDGHFLRGIPHGRGTMRSLDPPYIYEGLFYQGKRHGDGSLSFPDGSILTSKWKGDNPVGPATFSSRSKSKVKQVKAIENECTGHQLAGLRWSETIFIALDALYWGPGSGIEVDQADWRYLAELGQGHWAEHAAHGDSLDESALSEAETVAPPNEEVRDDSKSHVRIIIHKAEGLVPSAGPFRCQVQIGGERGVTRFMGGSHPEWHEPLELRREGSMDKLLMFKVLSRTGDVVGGCFSDIDDLQEVMQLTGRGGDGRKGYAGRLHVERLPPRIVELSEDDFPPMPIQAIRAQTSTHNHNIADAMAHAQISLQQQPTI